MFVDTHCHLQESAFDQDRIEAWQRAQAAGVSNIICIGADLAGSTRAAALAQNPGIFAAIGIHPESGSEWNDDTAKLLQDLYRSSPKVIAYGEIGLDYHWETLSREHQRSVFAEQIAFAESLDPCLPLMIHCRDAQKDVLEVLRAAGSPAPAIMHCFTGDDQAAQEALDAGCFLGIGGVITFKKSDVLRAAVADVPLDRLLLETDSPYLAPQPWRGKRNEPSYLPSIAAVVARLKGLSPEEVAAATTRTAQSLFRL